MDPHYEAQQLRAFGRVVHNGHVYRGEKPVHWCLDCRSALAEAEVEYEEKTSDAIDVAFRVVDNADLALRIGGSADELANDPCDIVIWTTPPWTLPANQAVAVRDEFLYVLVQIAGTGQRFILAAELLESCLARFGMTAEAILILNPDVRLYEKSVPPLVAALQEPAVGIVAPQVRSAQ